MLQYELSKSQIEVLREIGGIGAENAAAALSEMMGKKIGMTIPRIRILPFAEVPEVLGGADRIVAGIFTTVEGPAPCNTLLVFPVESAKTLAGLMMEQEYDEDTELDRFGKSALEEACNVVGGTYLNSLADFTKMDFIPSVPALAIDMAGAVLDTVLARIGMAGDFALLMETVFTEIEENVSGHFFLLPEEGSLDQIMEAIGVK